MLRLTTLGARVLATVALFGVGAGAASADPIHILALGDSITAGVGSSDSQFGSSGSGRGGSGYRRALNDLFAQENLLDEWQFVGRRSSPDVDDEPVYTGPPLPNNWHRHMGYPGETADGLRGRLPGFNEPSPNVILVHIGSNSSGAPMTSNPSDYTQTWNTAADAQLHRLLNDVGNTATLSTADRILVARIIPKGCEADLRNIIDYNYSTTQGISGAIAALPDPLREKIEIVDLFRVAITDAMLSFLVDYVDPNLGLGAVNTTELRDLIDPDRTGYVDWLDGLDEATHTITGDVAARTALFTRVTGYHDGSYTLGATNTTHPNDLGYAVMAWAWGQVVPEPTALALLGVGALVVACRRRTVA